MCHTSRAYHGQHAVCELKAQLLNLTEFVTLILVLLFQMKPITDEGGEETGVPGENP